MSSDLGSMSHNQLLALGEGIGRGFAKQLGFRLEVDNSSNAGKVFSAIAVQMHASGLFDRIGPSAGPVAYEAGKGFAHAAGLSPAIGIRMMKTITGYFEVDKETP